MNEPPREMEPVPPAEASRKLRAAALQVYREFDAGIAGSRIPSETTCTKGCSSCCHHIVLATRAEAEAIAHEFIAQADGRSTAYEERVKRRCNTAIQWLKQNCQVGDVLEDLPDETWIRYFNAKIPCPFLEPDQTCGIYEVRPLQCRSYYVSSAPARCAPPLTDANRVTRFDVKEPTQNMTAQLLLAEHQTGRHVKLGLPLQVAFGAVVWPAQALPNASRSASPPRSPKRATKPKRKRLRPRARRSVHPSMSPR